MAVDVERLPAVARRPWPLVEALTTVDHKRIGLRYLVTASAFFLAGGIEAGLMRLQLAAPNERVLGPEAYDQTFSMHGLTMIFLFVTPMLSGFANYVLPLQL
ncbi:MAG TPA: cbb3-type cytochrome c oxidase subunit I, partial [Gaiellaceae bacterium]|nr:cbb3-type cytochrome c oxidase subunit I [Gaiellaceae bacterium]